MERATMAAAGDLDGMEALGRAILAHLLDDGDSVADLEWLGAGLLGRQALGRVVRCREGDAIGVDHLDAEPGADLGRDVGLGRTDGCLDAVQEGFCFDALLDDADVLAGNAVIDRGA
jgi:hypothetical protein